MINETSETTKNKHKDRDKTRSNESQTQTKTKTKTKRDKARRTRQRDLEEAGLGLVGASAHRRAVEPDNARHLVCAPSQIDGSEERWSVVVARRDVVVVIVT